MKEIISKELLYKISSLLFAVLLWFFVTNVQNPIMETTFSISVNYYGLQEGLVTGDKPQNVDIKVKGQRNLITSLGAKDFKATVDLSQAKIGDGNYPVQVPMPDGVELVSRKPSSINLRIDTFTEKQLDIVVKIINTAAQGYSSFEPVLTPSKVVVRGARKTLESIEAAQITVDLNQAMDNLALSLPVSLLDKDGNAFPENFVEMSPKSVQVFVPVIQNVPVKTVSIKPVLEGKPREAWQVSRVVSEPETIKITGPLDTLMNIDQIMTQPIDINDLHENLTTQAALVVPPGINLLYEPTVKVVIQVKEAPIEKTFTDIPILQENLSSGLKATLGTDKVSVTLQGSKTDMLALVSAKVKALLDLTGLTPGTYHSEVKISIPQTIQVIKVEPSTVEVVISPQKNI